MMKTIAAFLVMLAIACAIIYLGDLVTTHHGAQVCQGQPTEGCSP